jgi:hypothetical protein
MASRIGGTIATPNTGSLLTWGSVRAPLVLLNDFGIGHSTVYSRAYPVTVDGEYPKIFIWESGSLFSWNKGNGAVPPWYYIELTYGEGEEEYDALFSIGIWPMGSVDYRVDNLQFSELLGEEVTTDVGDLNITQDAHQIDYAQPDRQLATGFVYTTSYPRIQTIGKLTPI